MTTKELLEKAARAQGVEIEPCTCSAIPFRRKDNHKHYSPDINDGDSARLEDALGIDIRNTEPCVIAVPACYHGGRFDMLFATEELKDHNNSRSAARRMAVLKLAAMIDWGRV